MPGIIRVTRNASARQRNVVDRYHCHPAHAVFVNPAGSPANPNTGELLRVDGQGGFAVVEEGLNQPTALEFIGDTAYVVTLGGEIWKIIDVTS